MVRNTAPRHKQAKNKKYLLVRFGRLNALGLFEHNLPQVPKLPTRVVIKTDRGLELGTLAGQFNLSKGCQCKLNSQQIKEYFDKSEIDYRCQRCGKIVRCATKEDLSEERHLRKIATEELQCCRRYVDELKLPMKIVDVEHIFGGERIIFYFMADGRVDFRELVKKVAQEYQTRVEMRQLGSRDEAKLLGDVESCGQQCCCQRFLKALKPVSMRMAKVQKATLDPSKISGYCGRLKCCLRYEDQTYTELKKRLPRKNTIVKSSHGKGRVVNTQILTQLVTVAQEDGTFVSIPLEEIEIVSLPTRQGRAQNKGRAENKKNNQNKQNGQNKTEDKKQQSSEQ